MAEYLNFSEISQKVSFKDLLDKLNISYNLSDGIIKGDFFIVDLSKNLYFNPKGQDKGSVINFLANRKQVDVRTAALELKNMFLKEQPPPKRDMPNLPLIYTQDIIDRGFSAEFASEHEFGFVKQNSIMAGKIAFKIYDSTEHIGYVGYNPKSEEWFFPKGFKKVIYNNQLEAEEVFLTVSIWEDLDLINKGFPAVSLIGKSMSDVQEAQLKKYKYIKLIHNEPDNIVSRIAKSSFIKISPRI